MPARAFLPHRTALDAHIGARIRARRHEIGQTQQGLAEVLETSFQQLQKYERGINRVSAAMLYDIAQAQEAPVSFYYEEFEPPERAA